MMKKHLGRLGSVLMVLMLSVFSIMPAYAGWEQGITSVPADKQDANQATNTEDISAYRDEIMRFINIEREKRGVGALKDLTVLTELSDIRASEAAVSFSHNRPDGKSCSTVFADHGIAYSAIGENLAYGFDNPSKVVKAWMNSKLHRENLLNEKFMYVGVGFYRDDKGIIYHSLLLYTPQVPAK